MADPTPFQPGFSYSGFESENPTAPKPGAELDTDFANLRTSVNGTIEALADIRRSDGQLHNEIVTIEKLAPEVRIMLGGNEDVEALAAIADEIEALGPIAAEIQIAANNIDEIVAFADLYLGPKPSEPTVRNDGSPLQSGDIFFDTTANLLKVYNALGVWVSASGQALNLTAHSYTSDGVTTVFTLPVAGGPAENVLVFAGGVRQVPNADYTVSGTTLTLGAAPENGVKIDVLIIGTTVNLLTPANGSVISSTITSDSTEIGLIRDKLGLGDSATRDVGSGSDDVAAGDHGHVAADISDFGTSVESVVGGMIGDTVQAYDAATLKADTSATLSVGYASAGYDFGTKSTGSFKPSIANGDKQYGVNGGAHTLQPPDGNCSMLLHYTNNGSAGAINVSGFTVVDGDEITTTESDEFFLYITVFAGKSHLTVKALQ